MNKSLNIFEKRLISPGLNAKDVCLHVLPVLHQFLPPSLHVRQTWLPVFRGISCACLSYVVPVRVGLCLSCYAVPVRVGLCLSLLRCACPCWAVPVFVTLCLSVLGCACLCYAVPFRVGLCLSLLRCACPCWAVPVFVTLCVPVRVGLCLSLLRCACPCWAVPVFVMSCLIEFSCDGPCVCLGCLETEY